MHTKQSRFAAWLAQQPDQPDQPDTEPVPVPPAVPLDAGQKDRLAALREMRELGHGID